MTHRLTKKDLALSLHRCGRTVNEISRALECHPSFIERWIEESGGKPLTHEQLNREIEERRVMYWGGRR